jgi:hypothetical protein
MGKHAAKNSEALRRIAQTKYYLDPGHSPNKATIYPDKLPDVIQKLNAQSQLDGFTAYMQQHGPPVLVDLRPALQNGRKEQELYYKTDTHWNSYGAFIAYTEIMKELSKTYSQLTPKRIKDFKVTASEPYLHDIPRLIGATNRLEPRIGFNPKENDVQWASLNDDATAPLQVSTTPKKKMPTLLMYIDSFGIGIQFLVAPHFSKATFINSASKYLDARSLKIINVIKPDVVILEILERSFNTQYLDVFLKQFLSEEN